MRRGEEGVKGEGDKEREKERDGGEGGKRKGSGGRVREGIALYPGRATWVQG